VLTSRKGGDMHRRVAKADDQPMHTSDLIESFVVTPEKLEKMGLAPSALPHGWWVGFKVNDDEQWRMVKSGERTAFSIHGTGTRTAVAKMGPEVKDWHVYHALRRKGHTKESSARIANSVAKADTPGRHRAQANPGRVRLGMAGRHSWDESKRTPWVNTIPKHSASPTTNRMASVKRVVRRVGAEAQVLEDRQPLAGKLVRWAIEKSASPATDEAREAKRKATQRGVRSLGGRLSQAVDPPPVKLRRVESSMASKVGYQPQTRRLVYRMRNGSEYSYRAKPAVGEAAVQADSPGRYYNEHVKGHARPTASVGPVGRARLFLDPVEKALR
jgi:hypothetical protein